MRIGISFVVVTVLFARAECGTVSAQETPPLAKAPFTAEQAKEYQQQWAKHVDKDAVYTNSIGMKLTFIPPGEFMMGTTEEKLRAAAESSTESQWYQSVLSGGKIELPSHRVRITKPFYMGSTEVTVAQFCQFAEESGYKTEAERGLLYGQPYKGNRPISTWRKPHAWRKPKYAQKDDEPVLHVCWNDCVAFCKWLSEKEGREYHLPTEAQWEYACRAGTDTTWYFADNNDDYEKVVDQYAWMSWEPKSPHPMSVGQKKPNAFGLYDMHGNVWEYVNDWYHEFYFKESPLNDPPGPKPVASSVDRSKSAINYTQLARSLVRDPNNPVIKVGEKGAWNDQTLGCFTVLDDGDQFFFYSDGAQFGKEKNVGMATSKDGVNWSYYKQNPLFRGSMPYAIKVGNTFRLYHPGDGGLQLRTSMDGFAWSEPRKVMNGCLDPCVIQVGENQFHLYFCSGGKINKDGQEVWQFKNYVATSTDGIAWDRNPNPVLPLGTKGTWDEGSHAGPCVLKLPDGFHMWYLGSGPMDGKIAWRIGHATSPDGLTWTKSGDEPVLDVGAAGAWDQGTFMSFDIIFRDGKLLFWYAAARTGHEDETKVKIQIGHGTSS